MIELKAVFSKKKGISMHFSDTPNPQILPNLFARFGLSLKTFKKKSKVLYATFKYLRVSELRRMTNLTKEF